MNETPATLPGGWVRVDLRPIPHSETFHEEFAQWERDMIAIADKPNAAHLATEIRTAE